MKNRMKRLSCVLLAVLMLLCSAPLSEFSEIDLISTKVSAATNGKSQANAISWLRGNLGKTIGNGQCPALAREYYAYLGYSVSGNGRDYVNNVMPGWTKIPYQSGVVAQPGDIAVWYATSTELGKKYGHVAVVESGTSSSMTIFEQGAAFGYKVSRNTIGYWKYGTLTCLIRPDFGGSSGGAGEMVEPVVAMPRFVFYKGEKVRITWNATPACSNFYQYWIVLDNKTTGKREFEGASSAIAGDAASNYFEFTANNLGDYGLGIYAVPYAQRGVSQKYTYSTFKVTDVEMKTPTITLNKQSYVVGDTVNITWEKTASNSDFYQYWVVVDNKTTNVRLFGGSPGAAGDVNANTYSFVPSSEGSYRIDVYSVPYYNKDARQKVSTKTITVTKKCIHSFISKTATQAYLKSSATCTSPAVYYYKCIKCTEKGSNSYTYGTALGHKYKTSVTAATCSASGVRTYTCTTCGKSYTETIAKTGHKYDGGKVTKAPTCSAEGVKTYTCTVCKSTKTEKLAKDPKNHGNPVSASLKNKAAATCTKDGYSGDKYCNACNALLEKGKTLKKTGHTDKNNDGYCDSCKKRLREEPTVIKGTKVSATTKNSLTVTWKKTGGSETVYDLFIAKKGEPYLKYAGSTKSNKFKFKKLSPGTTYCWSIIVWNEDGSIKVTSDYVDSSTLPSAPTIKVTAGKKKATVKWNAVKGAANYTVYYSTSKNSGFKKIGTTSGKSFTVKNLKPGRNYYFKVVANRKVGGKTLKSSPSAVKKVKIK